MAKLHDNIGGKYKIVWYTYIGWVLNILKQYFNGLLALRNDTFTPNSIYN